MAYEQAVPTKTAVTLTPSDTVPNREPYKHLHVGGAGTVTIKNADGSTVAITDLVAGQTLYNFAPSFITATGTTATNLVGLK